MSQESPTELQALSSRVQNLEMRLLQVELRTNLAWPPQPASATLPAATLPVAKPTVPLPVPLLADPTITKTAPPSAPNATLIPGAASFAPVSASRPSAPTSTVGPVASTAPVRDSTSNGWNEVEQLIGGRWALWLGALCLFLSAASFLAYTWHALAPWMHVGLGFVAGVALLATGALLRTRTQRWYSEGLFGAGISICYLSAWAAGPYYSIWGFSTASAALVGIAALGVGLAVRYDARSLSVLSTIGGFLTPMLLNSGSGQSAAHPWTFLTYLALLNATMLATGTFKKWGELRWLCFGATLFLLGGWMLNQLPSALTALRFPLWTYWTLYWLLFLATASWPTLAHGEEPDENDLLLWLGATSIYAPASWLWLRPALGAHPIVLPLGMAAVFALSAMALRFWRPETQKLRILAAACSLLAITLSFPSQYGTRGLSIFWTLEAGTLLLLASRLRSRLFVVAGQAVLAVSVLMLVYDQSLAPTPHIVFLNARALPLLLWTAVVTVVACERHWSQTDDEGNMLYPCIAALAGAFLLTQEIWQWFAWTHVPSPTSWEAGALCVIATVALAYALPSYRIGRRIHDDLLLGCGLCAGAAGLLLLPGVSCFGQTEQWPVLLNLRAAAFALGTIVLLAAQWLSRRDETESAPQLNQAIAFLPLITAAYALAGVSFELYFALDHDRATAHLALSMLWSAASVLLLAWPEARPNQRDAVRLFSLVVGIGALLTLIIGTALAPGKQLPLLNLRFLASGFTLGAALWGARHLALEAGEMPNSKEVVMTLLFGAWGLGLWMLTQETWQTALYFQNALGPQWERWGQLSVSLVWSLVATLTLLGGVARNSQPFRLASLAFLSLTATKVFLFDFSFLTGPLRVLSFGGLGLSLIFISWLYSRFVTPQAKPTS